MKKVLTHINTFSQLGKTNLSSQLKDKFKHNKYQFVYSLSSSLNDQCLVTCMSQSNKIGFIIGKLIKVLSDPLLFTD